MALVVLGIAALGLMVWLGSGPSEPTCQGKRLSAWLAQLDDHKLDAWSSEPRFHLDEKQIEAAEAIRHLGANVLPKLLADLKTQDRRFKALARPVCARLCLFFKWQPPSWFLRSERCLKAEQIRHRAALGLIALGPAAQPVVPQLTFLYTNFSSMEYSKEAALVLASLGPQGLAPLRGAITNPIWRPWLAIEAVWALEEFPTNGQGILTDLAAAATNGARPVFQEVAVRGLSQISTDAQFAVTALLPCLNDPRVEIRRETLAILEGYGAQATSAAPVLLQKLKTRDLHGGVLQTLRAIEPEAVPRRK